MLGFVAAIGAKQGARHLIGGQAAEGQRLGIKRGVRRSVGSHHSKISRPELRQQFCGDHVRRHVR